MGDGMVECKTHQLCLPPPLFGDRELYVCSRERMELLWNVPLISNLGHTTGPHSSALSTRARSRYIILTAALEDPLEVVMKILYFRGLRACVRAGPAGWQTGSQVEYEKCEGESSKGRKGSRKWTQNEGSKGAHDQITHL